MTELALPVPVRARAEALGRKAVRALYCAFLLSVPVETIFYFQSGERPDSDISIARVLGTLLIGLAAVQWRDCFKRLPAAFWLLACYVASVSLSQLWIPAEGFAKFRELQLTLIQMAALFLISYNLLADRPFREKVLRLYGWWMVLVALGMLSGVIGMDFKEESRQSVLSQDPNAVAAMLALGAMCIAADPILLGARRRLGHVAASLGAFGLLTAGILRTGSRGGLLAFAGGTLALAMCAGKATRKARLAVVGLVLVMGGGLVAREFAQGTDTAARLERTWNEGDTAGRTEIYDEAWSMVRERPLTGFGGGYNRYVLGARLNFPDRDTHNTYLEVLTEVGVLGGLPFFLVLLAALRRSWRCGRLLGDALPFALLVVLLIVNSSITGERQKIFWIVLAAACASA